MKKILLVLFCMFGLTSNAQSPLYVFNFTHVSTPGSEQRKKGYAKFTIYDDRTASIYVKSGNKEYRKSISIEATAGSYMGIILYSTSNKSRQDTEPSFTVSAFGLSAIYSDKRNGKYYLSGSNLDNNTNEDVYERMTNDLKNHKGAFKSFQGINDTELPYRFESPDVLVLRVDDASKGEYTGKVNYEGGLVGIIPHLKSGKNPEDVGIKYTLEIKPMNGETAEWIKTINPHPNLLAIRIDPNYGSHSRAASLIFHVNGKVEGRIFVIQLAKGSTMSW